MADANRSDGPPRPFEERTGSSEPITVHLHNFRPSMNRHRSVHSGRAPPANTMDCRTTVICYNFGLSSMQGGYEDDLIVVLQDVIAFSFQLPIGVVDQDENTRSHRVVVDEELASLFEQVLFQPTYQIIHICRLVIGSRRDLDLLRLLIRKEKLEATTKLDLDGFGGGHGARG